VVGGPLCESGDVFTQQADSVLEPVWLPAPNVGDLLVIHDAGAHGYAMGFQYNGKLRSAELLLRENGEVVQIRRAETPADYFATLDFAGLKKFRV